MSGSLEEQKMLWEDKMIVSSKLPQVKPEEKSLIKNIFCFEDSLGNEKKIVTETVTMFVCFY